MSTKSEEELLLLSGKCTHVPFTIRPHSDESKPFTSTYIQHIPVKSKYQTKLGNLIEKLSDCQLFINDSRFVDIELPSESTLSKSQTNHLSTKPSSFSDDELLFDVSTITISSKTVSAPPLSHLNNFRTPHQPHDPATPTIGSDSYSDIDLNDSPSKPVPKAQKPALTSPKLNPSYSPLTPVTKQLTTKSKLLQHSFTSEYTSLESSDPITFTPKKVLQSLDLSESPGTLQGSYPGSKVPVKGKAVKIDEQVKTPAQNTTHRRNQSNLGAKQTPLRSSATPSVPQATAPTPLGPTHRYPPKTPIRKPRKIQMTPTTKLTQHFSKTSPRVNTFLSPRVCKSSLSPENIVENNRHGVSQLTFQDNIDRPDHKSNQSRDNFERSRDNFERSASESSLSLDEPSSAMLSPCSSVSSLSVSNQFDEELNQSNLIDLEEQLRNIPSTPSKLKNKVKNLALKPTEVIGLVVEQPVSPSFLSVLRESRTPRNRRIVKEQDEFIEIESKITTKQDNLLYCSTFVSNFIDQTIIFAHQKMIRDMTLFMTRGCIFYYLSIGKLFSRVKKYHFTLSPCLAFLRWSKEGSKPGSSVKSIPLGDLNYICRGSWFRSSDLQKLPINFQDSNLLFYIHNQVVAEMDLCGPNQTSVDRFIEGLAYFAKVRVDDDRKKL
ncbi:hypothetical protein RCL1_004464 [Eukaryota sp. TZLM3-RCL]